MLIIWLNYLICSEVIDLTASSGYEIVAILQIGNTLTQELEMIQMLNRILEEFSQ